MRLCAPKKPTLNITIGEIMMIYKKFVRQRSLSRVHWLLFELSLGFKGYYKLLYDYDRHSYCFYHNYFSGRSSRLKEVFIVIRTSKRCYRLMYYDNVRNSFFYESFKSARQCAQFMVRIGYTRYFYE